MEDNVVSPEEVSTDTNPAGVGTSEVEVLVTVVLAVSVSVTVMLEVDTSVVTIVDVVENMSYIFMSYCNH